MATIEKWLMSEWYWIMPNSVLFDKNITDKQKLLFCLISSLCAEKWYCRASNKYLWEKLDVKEWTISNWIKELIEKWYIESDINKEKWNERHITICDVINHKTYCEKSQEGYCDNSQHNIITSNTTKENSLLNKEQQSWNQTKINSLSLVELKEKEKSSAKKEKEITTEINNLISEIKEMCDVLWVAYNKDMERQFAKHILTAKEYWEFCEKIGQTRVEFALNVLKVSVWINYYRGALSWPKLIYKHYAELYNQAKQKSPKLQTPTIQVL